jgi:hypothetical protein
MFDLQKNGLLKRVGNFFKYLVSGYQSSQEDLLPPELQRQLHAIWNLHIVPVLKENFGFNTVLYVIFYVDQTTNEMMMEVWDPKQVDNKPSQVFRLAGFEPELNDFPKNRNQAKKLRLVNWC